jgi:hypothetical protein
MSYNSATNTRVVSKVLVGCCISRQLGAEAVLKTQNWAFWQIHLFYKPSCLDFKRECSVRGIDNDIISSILILQKGSTIVIYVEAFKTGKLIIIIFVKYCILL